MMRVVLSGCVCMSLMRSMQCMKIIEFREDSHLSSQDGKQMLLNAPVWLASIVGIKQKT